MPNHTIGTERFEEGIFANPVRITGEAVDTHRSGSPPLVGAVLGAPRDKAFHIRASGATLAPLEVVEDQYRLPIREIDLVRHR